MKRFFSIVCMLFALACIFVACDRVNLLHTHEWGEWTITLDATCSQTGVETRACACGSAESRRIEKNDNHVVGSDGKCSFCGEVLTPNSPGFTPDYPAPPEDEGAEDIEDDEEKLDAPTGGGAVGVIYSNEVEIDLSDNKATILFGNPNRSTHDVTVDLVIQNQVVAKSGLLTPSKRLTSLTLEEGIATQLPAGVYNHAKFVVRFYDPETHACSIVNSEIAVTVTVRE